MKAIDKAIRNCDITKPGFHNDPTTGMNKKDYINWLMSEKGYSKSDAERIAKLFYK